MEILVIATDSKELSENTINNIVNLLKQEGATFGKVIELKESDLVEKKKPEIGEYTLGIFCDRVYKIFVGNKWCKSSITAQASLLVSLYISNKDIREALGYINRYNNDNKWEILQRHCISRELIQKFNILLESLKS